MGIEKYYEEIVRVKASSPRLAVCNTALMTAMLPYGFNELRSRHELWGHLFVSAVGARLMPSCRRHDIQLRYWNAGNKEVDFVLSKGDGLVAMEVKTADADSVSGMKEFKARYARAKPYLIGGQGMAPKRSFRARRKGSSDSWIDAAGMLRLLVFCVSLSTAAGGSCGTRTSLSQSCA